MCDYSALMTDMFGTMTVATIRKTLFYPFRFLLPESKRRVHLRADMISVLREEVSDRNLFEQLLQKQLWNFCRQKGWTKEVSSARKQEIRNFLLKKYNSRPRMFVPEASSFDFPPLPSTPEVVEFPPTLPIPKLPELQPLAVPQLSCLPVPRPGSFPVLPCPLQDIRAPVLPCLSEPQPLVTPTTVKQNKERPVQATVLQKRESPVPAPIAPILRKSESPSLSFSHDSPLSYDFLDVRLEEEHQKEKEECKKEREWRNSPLPYGTADFQIEEEYEAEEKDLLIPSSFSEDDVKPLLCGCRADEYDTLRSTLREIITSEKLPPEKRQGRAVEIVYDMMMDESIDDTSMDVLERLLEDVTRSDSVIVV